MIITLVRFADYLGYGYNQDVVSFHYNGIKGELYHRLPHVWGTNVVIPHCFLTYVIVQHQPVAPQREQLP